MAENKSVLDVSELDFDLIKDNLINFFKADPTFQDYEFEGSALNILLDILSANTHMNAVMANMSGNEMFIDSAQLRQNVVSLAKLINYTPRSKQTAQANIKLTFTEITGAPAYITIPSGTRFSTSFGAVFSTKERYLAYPDVNGAAGVYSIDEVEIFEGVFNTFNYVVDDANPDQQFIIPNNDVDLDSLIVSNTIGTNVTIFSKNDNITLLNNNSIVFFVHENPDGRYEITFGDNIIGKKPINGSTISLSYVVSQYGEEANGIDTFKQYQQIDGYSTYTITTNVEAFGAGDPESKEDIQLRAPQMYKAQSRAVVTADYENFMYKEYTFIDNMSVWGGEYNEPPIYGRVFLAIKPKHTEFLSDNLKSKIKDELIKKYNVVTVIPEIVDPDYTSILVNTEALYSMSTTTLSENDISLKINDAIKNYFEINTKKFNKPFYFSSLVVAINSADESVVSSLSDIQMMKKFYPITGASEAREIKFYNAITPGTIESSYFNIGGTVGATAKQQMKDDGNGILYTVNTQTQEIVSTNIGTVDYESGTLDFILLTHSLPDDTMDVRIYCTPTLKNITAGFNQIIIDDESSENSIYGRKQGIKTSVQAENTDYK